MLTTDDYLALLRVLRVKDSEKQRHGVFNEGSLEGAARTSHDVAKEVPYSADE